MYNAVIVEDEPWSLINIKAIFPWSKYNFETPIGFNNAGEALKYISSHKTDVLFTDIIMPDINGLKLIELIREKDSEIKIIVISGHADFSFAQQAINYGIFSYLLKPVDRREAEKLIAKLKTALDAERDSRAQPQKFSYISNPAFKRLLQFVDEHYNEKLQLNKLAEKFHINESYCSQLFKEFFGCGFTEYITEIKLQEAVKMLDSGMYVAEIADYLHYDYAYFNKLFKKRFGTTPKQYTHERGSSE